MNKHCLHGIVNEEYARPSKELVERFSSHSVATLSAVLHGEGLLNWHIKPVSKGKICGPAATVLCRQGDPLWMQRMADINQKGDVVVVDAFGVTDLAVVGERIGFYMMDKRGITGIVVDGTIRDSSGFREVNLPVYARGVCPKLFAPGPGAVNITIQCGGIIVNPGDLIIGDKDGVIAIPQEKLAGVIDAADSHASWMKAEFEKLGFHDYAV